MKKTLALAAALLFAGQFVNAQTQKGKQTFGLNGRYTHSTNSNGDVSSTGYPATQLNKYTYATIGPSYGYFIADGMELGGRLSYTYNRQTYDYYSFPTTNFNETKTNSFGVGAYLRKYVLYENKIGFRTGPYATYQWGKIDYNSIPGTGSGNKYTGYNLGANFDLVYYPTQRFGIAATIADLNYTKSIAKRNPTMLDKYADSENLNFNFITNGLALTLFYTFGGK